MLISNNLKIFIILYVCAFVRCFFQITRFCKRKANESIKRGIMTERVYLINDDNETYICMAKGLRTYGLGNVNILDKFLYESTVYSSPLRINDGIGIPENYVNVTEIDNKLCHAAIIAREFNKPLLMGVNKITKKFRTGDEVIVDFDNRTIKTI